jgi:hypothetical protein
MFQKSTLNLFLFLLLVGCQNGAAPEKSIPPTSTTHTLGQTQQIEENKTVVPDLSKAPSTVMPPEYNTTTDSKDSIDTSEKPPLEQRETVEQSWLSYRHEMLNAYLQEENSSINHLVPKKKVCAISFEDGADAKRVGIVLDGTKKDHEIKKTGRTSIYFQKKGDVLILQNIPVEEGRWYIISGFMRVSSLPADVMRYYVEFQRHGKGLDIPNYPMFAISKAGVWEEFVLPVYIKKDLGIDSIKLLFRDEGRPDAKESDGGTLWIDDISVYAVEDSASLFGLTPPAEKRGFAGIKVRVDRLGNFSIKEGNATKPFLPVVIYPDGNLQAWSKYKEKGFNTIICNGIKQAEKAAELNMYWIWSLYDYGIYDGNQSGYARFEQEYALLKKRYPNVLDKLLYFYWDNERYRLFDTIKHFYETIKKIDVNQNGSRLHPFVMQLDFTTANPHYINENISLVDLQSCYANPMIFEANDPLNYQGVLFKGNYDGEFANFAIFEHLPGVQIPKTLFVVNSPFGDKHIANTIFAAFARGGRGFAYWKDGGSQPPVEKKGWWKEFDKIVAQMWDLLPLLQTPHWCDWNLTASLPDDEDGLVVGKRNFGTYRCMIAASRSNKAEKVLFSAEDMQDHTKVFDYFSGKKVVESKDNKFELLFEPRGYGVWCWNAPMNTSKVR